MGELSGMRKGVFTAMRIRTIGYFVGEALQSLRRNNWMVLASIGTVAVSLIIVGVSLITVMNANYLAARLESNIEIIAYLKGNTGEEDARALKNDIRKIPGVDKVTFISKEDALYQFRKDLGDQQNMIDALGGDNPLPHHYKVSTISPQDVGKVAVKLQGVMTVLALAAIFLIATTIRLTVFARKKEIQIMKILGATDWFIRWPFLMEGMVLGSIGALIAVLFVDVSYITFTNYIQKDLNFNMFGLQTDSRFMFYLGVVMVGLGAFIGVLGSGISMRKFLKV
jgi:cell division transport system permease protein